MGGTGNSEQLGHNKVWTSQEIQIILLFRLLRSHIQAPAWWNGPVPSATSAFALAKELSPSLRQGLEYMSLWSLVGWDKGFSGLSSRSAFSLPRTAMKKTRSEGLPLLSLGIACWGFNNIFPTLFWNPVAVVSALSSGLQLDPRPKPTGWLSSWSCVITEGPLGNHWAVSDPDHCPQPWSWHSCFAHHPAHLLFHTQVAFAALALSLFWVHASEQLG